MSASVVEATVRAKRWLAHCSDEKSRDTSVTGVEMGRGDWPGGESEIEAHKVLTREAMVGYVVVWVVCLLTHCSVLKALS